MVSAKQAAQNIDLMMQQAIAAYGQGQIDAAIELFGQVLRIIPDHPDALNLRGTMHYVKEDFASARADQSKAVELDPAFPDFRTNYALTLRKLSEFAAAEQQLLAALRANPQDFKANLHYGQMLYDNLSKYKEAIPYLNLALKLKPDHITAQRVYASCLLMLNDHEKALPYFVAVEKSGQDDEDLLCALASCFYMTEQKLEAQKYCDKLLRKNPNSGKAHFISGSILADRFNYTTAVHALKKALEIEPDSFEIRHRLLACLLETKDFDGVNESLQYWRDDPKWEKDPAVMVHQYNYYRNIGDFSAMRQLPNLLRIKDLKTDPLFATNLSIIGLVMAEDDETSKKLFSIQREWGKFWEKKATTLTKNKFLTGKRPRRIGLLSSDFRDHSVGKFLLPVVEHIDQKQLELYGYSLMPGMGDKVHEHFQKRLNKFTDVYQKHPSEIAQIVADDNVDILIDLNGMTMGGQPHVLAWRCAPVQMTWLGYPLSTGLKNCDYIIVDRFLNPANKDCLTETPLILPDSSYLSFGAAEPRPIGDLPYDRNGYITFGSLNNPYKLGVKTIDLWRQVLQAMPDSKLLFVRPEFVDSAYTANIMRSIVMDDIDPARIMLKANYLPSHLDYYNEMDVSLDTYPVTGGTTTVESLWMGVPVVSRYGSQIHQRVSFSVLCYTGLNALCAATDEQYVEIALKTAKDLDRLRDLRKNLRPHLMKSPLIDTKLFAAAFTEALLSV